MTATDAPAPIALEARGITKRFPTVVANDDVSIQLRRGEILGLLGENGAGKSTLVKMLFGLYHPDEGEILINGEVVHLRNPGDAIERGVGMVHQHFQLVPVFTVAENIMLGSETHNGPFLTPAVAAERIRELSHQFGLAVDPNAVVEDLAVGTQQRVEILKALYRKADILILDEPTAVLTPTETDELLKVMRGLAENGAAIIFITHKLREAMAVCDTISVLRAGKVVGTTTPHETDRAGLANLMVGRNVVLQVEKGDGHAGDVVLDIEGLEVDDDRGQPRRERPGPGRARRRDRRHRRGRGKRPARARRGPVRDATGRGGDIRLAGQSIADGVSTRARSTASASPTSRRTARSTASSVPTRWPATSCSSASTRPRTPTASSATSVPSRPTPPSSSSASTSAHATSTTRCAPCPAATSRR